LAKKEVMMDKISELNAILREEFRWNKARLDCFTRMLFAMMAVRTVNLSEIAVAFASKAQVNSRYKRLYRFFKELRVDYAGIARWIFKLFLADRKLYLTIDRTNWFWGKVKINLLTLGMAYEGAAIPLLWKLLNKAGNATAKEHREIIQRFIDLFGRDCIAGVLGDREFASGELFGWCNKNHVPFYLRIKEGFIVQIKGKKWCSAKKLFNHLNPKQSGILGMDIELIGKKVYLAGSRSERGELMIVATNQPPHNAIAIYLRRWEIETLFSCLKGRGFRFEETHLTQQDRIEKLMALLAVGFCWAHKVGEWRASKKPIVFKQHRESLRPQNSFFRYGLDFIREILLSPFKKAADFRRCLQVLTAVQVRKGENL
jgi:hypothetical protein